MSQDVDLPVPATHFSGGANLTEGPGALAEILNNLDARLGSFHVPIASAAQISGPPGQLPPVEAAGALAYATFDLAAGTQKVYRVFKLPPAYVSGAAVHIHWTKSDDLDRSGEEVRWVVEYKVFAGNEGQAGLTPSSITLDDTYLDASVVAGDRVSYRTSNGALVGAQAGYYVAVSISKGTPAGSAMAQPALITCDLTFQGYVNRTATPVL